MRRKHSKIETELPPELIEEVNARLVEGHTYQEVTDWLKEMGHQISKSSVGRYGKDFLSRLERLRVVKEQARAIVEESGDRPATEMHEAANQLAVQLIMETLITVPDMKEAEITEVLKALALLERSAVSREKLKYEFTKGVEAGLAKLKEELKSELNSDPDLLQRLFVLADKVKDKIAS